jgi:hypothetical protein
MGEDPIPAKHFAFIDWVKAKGTDAVKRLLAQSELIYVWRRRPAALGDVTGVVHQVPFRAACRRQAPCPDSLSWRL